MSRFRHQVDLVQVPRPLLDDVVRSLLDSLEGMPFVDGRLSSGSDVVGDVRLVEGEHLTAGARYRIVPPDTEDENPDIEVWVKSWNRSGECRVEVRCEIGGHVVTGRVELRMAGGRPRSVRIEGDYQGPGPLRVLQRAKWEGEAQFDDWWAVLGHRTTPITLRVRHPLAGVSLLIGRGKDKNGRWAAVSTLQFGGRGIARPAASFGLLVMRRRIRRFLRDAFGQAEVSWNKAVPSMVERGLQDRVTLRCRTDVKAVPREWAEQYVAALHRAVEGLRFEKGRFTREKMEIQLLEGEHIEPGARYRISHTDEDPLDVRVAAWAFDGPSRIEFGGAEDGDADVDSGWIELDSAAKPALVRGAISGEAVGSTEVDCTVEGDLERWWASVSGSNKSSNADGAAAFAVNAEHPLAEGTLAITGSPAKGDQWTVEVTATVEGREWARPLVAVAGLFHVVLNDPFELTVYEATEKWNRMIPVATASGARRAAEDTLGRLLGVPAEDVRPYEEPGA